MVQLLDFIDLNSTYFIIALSVAFLVVLILYIAQIREYRKHKERYDSLTRGLSGANIEDLFIRINSELSSINRDINLIEDNIETIETKVTFTIQKMGFVRYNAFADTGSELSFSIALMDAYNNGFVLTSIYGREQAVMFGKPIQNANCNVPLSPEEMTAINRALMGESSEKIL
ncbi:DUF4446 family protein [Gudongella sp. DL1XJH-153]|uniref:DUF4446 family protein n=1 Tax=Gudongella sp. DL1XJH-153 TaxID=3409804 RepID=UPI003BB67BB1